MDCGLQTTHNKGYILHSQSLVWASPNAAEKRGTLHSLNRYRQLLPLENWSIFAMKRTLKGFIWFCWGQLSWFVTGGCGCHMYLRGIDNDYNGFKYHVGGWLVSQYGYSRNPEWPSKNELAWYRKNKINNESATTCQ